MQYNKIEEVTEKKNTYIDQIFFLFCFKHLLLGFSWAICNKERIYISLVTGLAPLLSKSFSKYDSFIFMILLTALQLFSPFYYFSLPATTAKNDDICFKL